MTHMFSPHQEKQVEVIDRLEEQIADSSIGFSTVAPVDDYTTDTRMSLTSVHLPKPELVEKVQNMLIKPLREVAPDIFYYPSDSLHMTIKNIRIIHDPPRYTDEEKQKAQKVFASVIPQHKKFNVYFYRLLLFPNNLALIGTTDPELDHIILDIDDQLNKAGIPDDKKYANSQYFFSNMTLARFNKTPSSEFKKKVNELSDLVVLEPYIVDSITLLTCNAVFTKKTIIDSWELG